MMNLRNIFDFTTVDLSNFRDDDFNLELNPNYEHDIITECELYMTRECRVVLFGDYLQVDTEAGLVTLAMLRALNALSTKNRYSILMLIVGDGLLQHRFLTDAEYERHVVNLRNLSTNDWSYCETAEAGDHTPHERTVAVYLWLAFKPASLSRNGPGD